MKGDGIESKGKTKGKIIRMSKGKTYKMKTGGMVGKKTTTRGTGNTTSGKSHMSY